MAPYYYYTGCCVPRTCCFGRRSAVSGARINATVDAVFNLAVLAFLLSVRPLFSRPPSALETGFWPLLLVVMDVLLINGLRHRRVILLAMWQLVFLLHLFLLLGLTCVLVLVVLPNLGEVSAMSAAKGVDDAAVQVVILAAVALAAASLPFHIYAFRIVNGAKVLLLELQLEAAATQASRIMVRRHSEPAVPTSSSEQQHHQTVMGMSFARELLGVDRLSQSMHNLTRRARRDSNSIWIHQDMNKQDGDSPCDNKSGKSAYYNPNGLFSPESGDPDSVPDVWAMTQPISMHAQHDPMRPFMPMYPTAKPGGIFGMGMGGPGTSSRVQPVSGFIMPSHVGLERTESNPATAATNAEDLDAVSATSSSSSSSISPV